MTPANLCLEFLDSVLHQLAARLVAGTLPGSIAEQEIQESDGDTILRVVGVRYLQSSLQVGNSARASTPSTSRQGKIDQCCHLLFRGSYTLSCRTRSFWNKQIDSYFRIDFCRS